MILPNNLSVSVWDDFVQPDKKNAKTNTVVIINSSFIVILYDIVKYCL